MSLLNIFGRIGLRPAVVGIGVLSLGTSAFATSNTFNAATNVAGQNSQAVSGYTISAPSYTLNATNAANIDSVSFTATGAVIPGTAKVKLSSAYKSCSITGSVSPWTITATTAARWVRRSAAPPPSTCSWSSKPGSDVSDR